MDTNRQRQLNNYRFFKLKQEKFSNPFNKTKGKGCDSSPFLRNLDQNVNKKLLLTEITILLFVKTVLK